MRHRAGVVTRLAISILIPCAATTGQQQLAELGREHLPQSEHRARAVVMADVDKDGRPDLVFANSGQNRLYRNTGNARFVDETSRRLPAATSDTMAVAAGDVDGDGDVDLVFGNGRLVGQQTRLLQNDGRGNFTDVSASQLPTDAEATRGVLLVDVDKDGDLDLVLANTTDFFGAKGQNQVYVNDGRGRFTDATQALAPAVRNRSNAVAVGDLNGDGSPDLVFANEPGTGLSGRTSLWLGSVTGRFTDASAALPAGVELSRAVAIGDADRDGDLDVLVGNAPRWNGNKFVGGRDNLLLGDGKGKLTDATSRLPAVTDEAQDLAFADIDGDADMDIVIANGDTALPQKNRVLVNDGAGRFQDRSASRLAANVIESSSVVAGDLDGDRDLDLVFTSPLNRDELHLNDGAGVFVDATATPLPHAIGDSLAATLADLDGDGDLDLLVGDFFANRLLLNDGSGSFRDVTGRLRSGGNVTPAVAAADFDLDGDVDIVLGNYGERNQMFLNDGNASFREVTASHMPLAKNLTGALAWFDADGDSDLDLFVGNSPILGAGGQNRLYLNGGNGIFTDSTFGRLPADNDDTLAVVAADFTGDGKTDVVVGNWGQGDRFYVGDGKGKFQDKTAGNLRARRDLTRTLAAADFDGDTDIDLIIGVENGQNRLLLNDGKGKFTDVTATRFPVDRADTRAVKLADFDHDGDLDAFIGNSESTSGGRNFLYLNDGRGTFTDGSTRISGVVEDTLSLAIGDVDSDGDTDVFVGNALTNRMLYNLHRNLFSPFRARAGSAYHLDVYGRPGYATTDHLVVSFLSLATTKPGIRLREHGVLQLDPKMLLYLPVATIKKPGGSARIALQVPGLPVLRGRSLFTQAILLPLSQPMSFRLTGLVQDRVLF